MAEKILNYCHLKKTWGCSFSQKCGKPYDFVGDGCTIAETYAQSDVETYLKEKYSDNFNNHSIIITMPDIFTLNATADDGKFTSVVAKGVKTTISTS
ncbi:MAG TPA: hypothetical protein VI819_00450 [Patescibacteria group bacterium]|nr:hypothetical protein [Patescibacteria group bacterium]